VLFRQGGTLFCGGRSRFLDTQPGSNEATSKIYVKIVPEPLGEILVAQLDTAAAWTILDADVADAMSLLQGDGFRTPLSTRFGRLQGRLERLRVDIVADDGDSCGVEATVWVSREWRHGNFLGYEGFLNRIRFAIDPTENRFYFGAV
jgi:hypothetical protein